MPSVEVADWTGCYSCHDYLFTFKVSQPATDLLSDQDWATKHLTEPYNKILSSFSPLPRQHCIALQRLDVISNCDEVSPSPDLCVCIRELSGLLSVGSSGDQKQCDTHCHEGDLNWLLTNVSWLLLLTTVYCLLTTDYWLLTTDYWLLTTRC